MCYMTEYGVRASSAIPCPPAVPRVYHVTRRNGAERYLVAGRKADMAPYPVLYRIRVWSKTASREPIDA